MNGWVAAFTAFTASGVEFVEAATIVMAVGFTAGWRVALTGAAWAAVALVVIAGVLGPALVLYVPLWALQLAIGLFLMFFGFTWLRKAVWRYAGLKASRDERQKFAQGVNQLRERDRRYAFAMAFNGVLIEGLEVAVIVITFAAGRGAALAWAAGGALLAGVVVTVAALLLRRPLARVPENAMAFVVGVMLLSFGTFWSGEGLHVNWWSGDLTLAWIVACYAAAALLLIVLRRNAPRRA